MGRSDREPVDLRRLVAGFLRMAPDVAIVGEVRDRKALPELPAHVATVVQLATTLARRAEVLKGMNVSISLA